MGILSSIGWLVSGVVGFVPGLHRYAIYAVALTAVLGMGALWFYNKGSEGRAAAVAQCQSACSLKIADMQIAAERTISDILSSVNEESRDFSDVADYCKQNPGLCRSDDK